MERVSVLCLLLLHCALLGAELQNSEIVEQRKAGPDNANGPEQPQPVDSEINAILREMSATLAEHRVRINMLETLNREQAAKLRELEQQTIEVDTLKLQQQAQATEVDTLKEQQQAQAAELWSITARTGATETHVESLKQDRVASRVAFSASLLASGSGNVGPFNTHTTLVFKHIFSNIGHAYNRNTGFFTAPVRGAYHFQFHAGAIGSSHGSIASLVKNEQLICNAYEHQPNGFGTSANGATLLLQAGDVVSLRLWAQTIIHDSQNHHSTFTGFLLFPLLETQTASKEGGSKQTAV